MCHSHSQDYVNDGTTVHLTGQVAWDQDEQVVGKGNIEECRFTCRA